MQCWYASEPVLVLPGELYAGVPRIDCDNNGVALKSCQGILQSHAEAPQELLISCGCLLLWTLVLCEVTRLDSTTKVADGPAALSLSRNFHISGIGEGLFVQGVSQDLSNTLGRAPMLQELVDVEIEEPRLR